MNLPNVLKGCSATPAAVAKKMLEWYNRRGLRGLGASTLKALRVLQVGAHWGLSGRTGEYAAGNGAAMRIAPLAVFLSPDTDRQLVRDVCFITHKNDEACTGCMAIPHALALVLAGDWFNNSEDWILEHIASLLPDTLVKEEKLR
ncbi:MAG TPA: ADP-ribosylglycohydrolase family protein [Puia sp.]|jgi:ADP-ribosylglycohydrolase